MSLSLSLVLVVCGLLAGFLTGLLGVGGGVVMVPSLYQIFLYQGESSQAAFTGAVATSLVVMIFTGTYAAMIHRRHGLLDRTLLLWTGAGTTVGAMLGVNIMVAADGQAVRFGFGCFLWLVAASMYLPKVELREQDQAVSPGYKAGLLLTGCLMGTVSGLFGIGGTTLVVPALVVLFGIAIHQAIATATGLIVISALWGASSYLVIGLNGAQGLAPASGWIHPWAAALMIPGALFCSRLGIALTRRFSRHQLRATMVLFQVSVGARFIFF